MGLFSRKRKRQVSQLAQALIEELPPVREVLLPQKASVG